MTTDREDTRDVAARMDGLPVTSLHVLALVLCALGLMLDTVEIALGSALAAVFSAPAHAVPAGQLSLLLGSIYVGAMFGAPLLGLAADRFGRRRVLVGVLVWIGMTSLIAAACREVPHLSLVRGLSGVALGAYPPIMIAFLTDLLPPLRRGMLIFLCASLATVGPPLALLLVRWLTPLQPLGIEAWRWGFIGGGAAAITVGVAFCLLPESPRWLQAKGYTRRAEATWLRFERARVLLDIANKAPSSLVPPSMQAGAEAAAGRRWPFVAALYLLSPWATVAFPLLSGAVLMQKGFKLTDTLMYVGLSSFGPMIGTLLAATSIDRVDRRLSLALCAVGMILFGFAFFAGHDPIWLIVASGLFGMSAALYIPTLAVYSAELFPTGQRASSTATAWALNRFGAAIAPLLLLPLLRNTGPLSMFAVIAAALLLSVGVLTFAPTGKQRAAVA
jgi:MFS transporter, putative metabolite:H+ symporter